MFVPGVGIVVHFRGIFLLEVERSDLGEETSEWGTSRTSIEPEDQRIVIRVILTRIWGELPLGKHVVEGLVVCGDIKIASPDVMLVILGKDCYIGQHNQIVLSLAVGEKGQCGEKQHCYFDGLHECRYLKQYSNYLWGIILLSMLEDSSWLVFCFRGGRIRNCLLLLGFRLFWLSPPEFLLRVALRLLQLDLENLPQTQLWNSGHRTVSRGKVLPCCPNWTWPRWCQDLLIWWWLERFPMR